ncbi:MAG: tetratricopeptide repeat protein [Myxococcota bacterium]
MKQRLMAAFVGLFVTLIGMGGNCSRARVESMNKMNEGVMFAQTKRYVDAVDRLEQATAMDATNEEAFYNLSLVHIEMQNFERARDDLQRAIALNGERAGYHEKLGTVLMQMDNWTEAKAAFEQSIALDPSLFKAYYKLAQCHEELDDPQSALQQYTLAIEQGPRFLEAYSQLGRLYASLGYLDEAVTVLQSALQVAQPGTAEEALVHHLLGTVYQQQRNFDGAVGEFRSALDIEPGMHDALFSLGWTYSLQENRDEAQRYLKKYVDTAGAEAPSHYMKAATDRLGELQQL